MNHYDVIVAGVGTMGAATCAELAARGMRVLGLEQFDIPHTFGAHHGCSRIYRTAYYEHPDYVPLLFEARAAWVRMNEESDRAVFRSIGGLWMGSPDCELVSESINAARAYKIDHEVLDGREIRSRYPQFDVPDSFSSIFEPTAGVLFPEEAIRCFATQAMRRGAELRARERLLDWDASSNGVRVRTASDTFVADRLIVTTGPWSGAILGDLGVNLFATRQPVAWVWPRRPEVFEPEAFPCWAIQTLPDRFSYGFPMLGNDLGLKIALHRQGPQVDPDAVERAMIEGDEDEYQPALREYLPDADGPLVAHSVCLYGNSPDSHFILDRHPEHERVVIAAGFSGHGFKFAPVIGQALSDLALEGTSELPIQFLSLRRFEP